MKIQQKSLLKKEINMSLATWKIPENISASNEVDIEKRIKYYRFNM